MSGGLKEVTFPSKEWRAMGKHAGHVWFWQDSKLLSIPFDTRKIREIEDTDDQLCFWAGDRPFKIKIGDPVGVLQVWLAEVAPINGERWEPTAENVPWRKVIVRLTVDDLDAMLGNRDNLRPYAFTVSLCGQDRSINHVVVKMHGPTLPEKYTTPEGEKIQTIDWAQFKREVLEEGSK